MANIVYTYSTFFWVYSELFRDTEIERSTLLVFMLLLVHYKKKTVLVGDVADGITLVFG